MQPVIDYTTRPQGALPDAAGVIRECPKCHRRGLARVLPSQTGGAPYLEVVHRAREVYDTRGYPRLSGRVAFDSCLSQPAPEDLLNGHN